MRMAAGLVAALVSAAALAPARPPARGGARAAGPAAGDAGAPRPGSMKEALQRGAPPYGEGSRRFRRTVYTQEDWLKHRSSTRLFKTLGGTLTSGVVRSLLVEVGVVTGFALAIVMWNAVLFGYVDLANVAHAAPLGEIPGYLRLTLPALPFTLSSPALGLLLVFRTNSSYQRWLEARITWGRVVASTRNVLRQASAWLDADVPAADRARVLSALGTSAWAFCAALRLRLSAADERPMIEDELTAGAGDLIVGGGAAGAQLLSAALLNAASPPLRALRDLSERVVALPMDEKRRVEMDKSLIVMGDCVETCERILSAPVPLVYTRHTARFLSAWLLLVPLALWEPFGASWNHLSMVPATALLAIFLFGIEELAVQLEEPFSILPLQKLCDDVRGAAADLVA